MKLLNEPKVFVVQMASGPCVRARKVVSSLAQHHEEVVYVGCSRGVVGSNDHVSRIVLLPPKIPSRSLAKLFLAPIWILIASVYLRRECQSGRVYACDFEAGAAAMLSGRAFVYDVLDTYADRYKVPLIVRALLRAAENFVVARASALIHVDDARVATLNGHPTTFIVRNLPTASSMDNSVEQPASGLFAVMVSGNLNEARGVDLILEASYALPDISLVLIGHMSERVRMLVDSNPRVRYFGYVSSAEALAHTRQCQAVYAAYDPRTPINIIASPNKLYDAFFCSIPVIVNEEIKASRMVEEHALGWTFKFSDAAGLQQLLRRLAADEAFYSPMVANVKDFRKSLPYWGEEFSSVVTFLRGL